MKDFVMEFIIKRENGRTLCIVNISIGTDESQENVGETEKCKYFLIENIDWYKGEWTWSHLCQLLFSKDVGTIPSALKNTELNQN